MNPEPFFAYMNERELIRLHKDHGDPWPWTADQILQTYKFTNVRRADDRTTRWVKANWYDAHQDAPPEEILFNCAVFRWFGTAEFAAALGWQRWQGWHPEPVAKLAAMRLAAGERVFTGAYVITNNGRTMPKEDFVSRYVLQPFHTAAPRLVAAAARSHSWRTLADCMTKLDGFGGTGFMAKEVLLDAMLTSVLADCRDRNSWCPAGPGARRGLNRLYNRPLSFARAPWLDELLALYRLAPQHMRPHMPDLELHDIQFCLCEFDKYERVRLNEGTPRSRYHASA